MGAAVVSRRSLGGSDLALQAAALDAVADSVVITDATGRVVFVNRAFTTSTGYSREEAMNATPALLKSGLTPPSTHQQLWQAILSGRTWQGEVTNRRKSGVLYTADLTIVPVPRGDKTFFVATHRDVTDRRRAEDAFRRAARSTAIDVRASGYYESMLRHLADALPCEHAFLGEYDEAEEAVLELFSWTRDGADSPAKDAVHDVIGRLHPPSADATLGHDASLGEHGVDSLFGAWLLDARRRPIGVLVAAARVRTNSPEIARDVFAVFAARLGAELERRRAEETVRRSEESFRDVIEGSLDAIAVIRRGAIAYANRAACELAELARDELVGRPILELVPEAQRAAHRDALQRAEAGATVSPPEVHRHRGDGSLASIDTSLFPITFLGEPAVVAVARDTTAQKKLAANMMRMDRMVAVGTLAAGVAHEINNPLSYVTANLELVTSALARVADVVASSAPARRDDPLRRAADELLDLRIAASDATEGALRIGEIVHDLLSYSRHEDETLGPVEVRPLVESALRMAWHQIRHRAALVRQLEDVPPVRANAMRLHQVLLNLLVNAAQSIEEGAASDHEIRVRTFVDEDSRVCLEVSDTGCGVPEALRNRIFDAFFTTKPIGVGTGLGLAISQSIVRSFSGELELDGTRERGSSFCVRLPAAPEQPRTRASAPTSASSSRLGGARARVLVVDDDRLVRTAFRRVLSPEHDVVVAESGRQALSLLAQEETFEVIISDLMMPEMGGMELYAELERIDPGLARGVVFVYGGASTRAAREFLDRIPNERYQKPVAMETMRAIVRRRALG